MILRYVKLEKDDDPVFHPYETHGVAAELGALGWLAKCVRHDGAHTACHPILSVSLLLAAAACAAWMQEGQRA